ncbi:MAG: hypothetical protein MZV70_66735 [Desulfobacterales bacterium]|nr:hypothetical protein [Desulfobacterales bacterium]
MPEPRTRRILKKAEARSTRRLFGKEPEVKAVHAGLECGIIGEKFPGMDMISFGPTHARTRTRPKSMSTSARSRSSGSS